MGHTTVYMSHSMTHYYERESLYEHILCKQIHIHKILKVLVFFEFLELEGIAAIKKY